MSNEGKNMAIKDENFSNETAMAANADTLKGGETNEENNINQIKTPKKFDLSQIKSAIGNKTAIAAGKPNLESKGLDERT
jgi:hypothetical protein